MDDQTRKNPKESPEVKDLPPKQAANTNDEDEKVKGGFEPINERKLK